MRTGAGTRVASKLCCVMLPAGLSACGPSACPAERPLQGAPCAVGSSTLFDNRWAQQGLILEPPQLLTRAHSDRQA